MSLSFRSGSSVVNLYCLGFDYEYIEQYDKVIQLNHPPLIDGRRLRIYYLTQVSCDPPTFVLFVNNIEWPIYRGKDTWIRKLLESHPFPGLPLRFILRDKQGLHKQDFDEDSGFELV